MYVPNTVNACFNHALEQVVKIADIRKDYTRQALSPSDCTANPIDQFNKWLEEALDENAAVKEATAVNVASVGADGRPSSRIVLLKGVEDGKFLFYTNYNSRKGQQLTENPFVALTFFWPELERQVRIEGTIARVPENVSDAYFQSRPYNSRIGAWASPQSTEIESNATLVKQAAKYFAKFIIDVPRPPHWGGFAVTPDRIEFWQGRPSRMHDRVVYLLEENDWRIARLAP